MKPLRNQDGVALITALMLTLLAMVMVFAVLYIVLAGIKSSSAQKSYRNSLEASYGGAEFITRDILPQIFQGYTSSSILNPYAGLVNLKFNVSNNCLRDKLNNKTGNWSACTTGNPLSEDAKDTPDMVFTLKGSSALSGGFKVYSKIVDSQPGNSDMSGIEMLESGSGVTGTSSGVSPKHVPGLYKVEISGEKELNPKEKANLSVLYAY